jgi:acetyl esterase/lipase
MQTFDPSKYGTAEQDVTYCQIDGQALQLNLYYPAQGGPWPGVIFIHGGGWTEGDKATLPMTPTEAGYLIVSLDYRMYPAYRFPAMIEDVKSAIRYLRAHAAAYNLDPNRTALIGHSAGAHLAALAGLADERAGWDVGQYLQQSSQVQAVVEVSGPTDLRRKFPEWVTDLKEKVFGEEQLLTGSPVYYAHAKAPPFLIIHGEEDEAVPVEQADLLYQALRAVGAPVEKLILQHGGHGLEAVGGAMVPSIEQVFSKLFAFLEEHLGK